MFIPYWHESWPKCEQQKYSLQFLRISLVDHYIRIYVNIFISTRIYFLHVSMVESSLFLQNFYTILFYPKFKNQKCLIYALVFWRLQKLMVITDCSPYLNELYMSTQCVEREIYKLNTVQRNLYYPNYVGDKHYQDIKRFR